MIASDEEQQAAFQRYTEARAKVEASLSFEDGRAAAQAWATFLDLYLPHNEEGTHRSIIVSCGGLPDERQC